MKNDYKKQKEEQNLSFFFSFTTIAYLEIFLIVFFFWAFRFCQVRHWTLKMKITMEGRKGRESWCKARYTGRMEMKKKKN